MEGRPDWAKIIEFDAYLAVYWPEHPAAFKGHVYAQRAVVEQHLGRYLTTEEIVHHVNENKHDNSLPNLKVMSREEHTALHHPKAQPLIKLVCPECARPFYRRRGRTHLVRGRSRRTFCSRRCNGIMSKRLQIQRLRRD